jgi:hypothetical protein
MGAGVAWQNDHYPPRSAKVGGSTASSNRSCSHFGSADAGEPRGGPDLTCRQHGSYYDTQAFLFSQPADLGRVLTKRHAVGMTSYSAINTRSLSIVIDKAIPLSMIACHTRSRVIRYNT